MACTWNNSFQLCRKNPKNHRQRMVAYNTEFYAQYTKILVLPIQWTFLIFIKEKKISRYKNGRGLSRKK